MKIRKWTVSILVLSLIFVVNAFPKIALAGTIDYAGTFAKMQQFGIVDSSIESMDSTLTREQLLKALIASTGLQDKASTLVGATIFPDIEPDSEMSGYVNAVVQAGIMYGAPDGLFHLEKNVTFAEICTMTVKLLGYTDSDLTGVWPTNYINKAKDLDLIKDISLRKNDNVTAGVAAVIFDRLLDTNVKKTSTSATDTTFAKSLNLYTECLIYDNSKSNSSLSENAVLTDKGVFYLGNDSLNIQVGNKYRLKMDNNTIEMNLGKARESKTIIINSAVENTVYYKEDNTIKTIELPSELDYYYHGVKKTSADFSDILKTDSTVVLVSSEDKTGYEEAVVIDPVYSKPEIASNFKPSDNQLGNIVFDEQTPIMKYGKEVTKNDIADWDVVYEVTDINGNNKCILVLDKKVEGYINAFLPNASSPRSVKIDTVGYNFSKDMNLSNLSKFKNDDLVSGLLGYDDKIVSLRSITTKTGTLTEVKIVGNSKTGDNLADNQVSADPGTGKVATYTLLNTVGTLELGAKYNLYISGGTITKVSGKVSNLEKYVVKSITGNTVTCIDESNNIKTMTLPQASTYYYHGSQMDYNSIVTSIQPSSTIILSKNGTGSDYEYAVVADPYFGQPNMYDPDNKEAMEDLVRKYGYSYVYKNGIFMNDIEGLKEDDVFYFVSDILDKTSYIYACDTTVFGTITKINKVNPTSIQVNGEDYELSQYFDKKLLYDFYTYDDDYITLYLGVDGKVVYIQ